MWIWKWKPKYAERGLRVITHLILVSSELVAFIQNTCFFATIYLLVISIELNIHYTLLLLYFHVWNNQLNTLKINIMLIQYLPNICIHKIYSVHSINSDHIHVTIFQIKIKINSRKKHSFPETSYFGLYNQKCTLKHRKHVHVEQPTYLARGWRRNLYSMVSHTCWTRVQTPECSPNRPAGTIKCK